MDEALREKILGAEKRIAGVRLLVVLSGTLLFPWFVGRPGIHEGLGFGLLAAAWAYAAVAYYREPYRRYPILLSTYLMSTTDAAFTMVWLYATGGYESPFYVALYLAIVGVAFRYRTRETLFAAFMYAASYAGLLVAMGEWVGHELEAAVRITYLFLAASIGAAVAQEVYAQSRSRAETRRLLEEARSADERLQAAQRIAHVGSFEWDTQTRALRWSDELYSIFGLDRASYEPTIEDLMARIHPDDRGRILRSFQRALEDGTGFDFDGRASRPDGATRHLHVRGQVALGRTGHPERLSGVCFDVTGQREMEEERLRGREQAAELERLKQITEFKSDFINTAAHELSTPLTPLRLQLHLLRRRRPQWSPEETKALDVLDRNVDRMARLIEDMLDAARLQASRLGVHKERVDLHQLVGEAVDSFQPVARQSQVTLEVEGSDGLWTHADPKRIGQVLFNLVHNAIKYTPAGGHVTIREGRSLGGATVEVRDSGVGLAQDQIARLFQPFSRVHETIRPNLPGTGLGLFVCKGIVELHDGQIWAASDGLGRGATFGFRLPLLEEGDAEPTPQLVARRATS